MEQYKQKLLTPSIEELEPAKKAKASVSDVIVIEGPECLMASINRFYFDCFNEV